MDSPGTNINICIANPYFTFTKVLLPKDIKCCDYGNLAQHTYTYTYTQTYTPHTPTYNAHITFTCHMASRLHTSRTPTTHTHTRHTSHPYTTETHILHKYHTYHTITTTTTHIHTYIPHSHTTNTPHPKHTPHTFTHAVHILYAYQTWILLLLLSTFTVEETKTLCKLIRSLSKVTFCSIDCNNLHRPSLIWLTC